MLLSDDGTEVTSPEAMDGISDFGALTQEAEEGMGTTEEREQETILEES